MLLVLSPLGATFGCSSSLPKKEIQESRVVEVDIAPRSTTTQQSVQYAPWELPETYKISIPEFASGDGFAAQGAFEHALREYRKAGQLANSQTVREAALLRAVSSLLKLGQSKQALEETAEFSKLHGVAIQDLSPQLSLAIGFAYEHQGDTDQAIAWYALSELQAGPLKTVELRARDELEGVIRSLSEGVFQEQELKWRTHRTVGPIFERELSRRLVGGQPAARFISQWFATTTYVADRSQIDHSVVSANASPHVTSLGVLLPLSGSFAPYGEQVRRGIELAITEVKRRGININLYVADTAGQVEQAIQEYERLVQEHAVSLVFGPLLVNTTLAVAERAHQMQVPIISFTKRDGVPELSPYVFRLGATADSQVDGLIDYAARVLQLKTYTVLYPTARGGSELARSFRAKAQASRIDLIGELAYNVEDENSLASVLSNIQLNPPDAVFIADSLEFAYPLLQQLYELNLPNTVLLGPAAWDDIVALRGFGSLIEGAVFVTPFFNKSMNPEVAEFIEAYRIQYGTAPELLAAQAYDATRLVLRSIPADVAIDSQSLIQALLESAEFYGATGVLKVDSQGEIQRKMSIVRLVQGEPTEVYSGGLQQGLNIHGQRTGSQIFN